MYLILKGQGSSWEQLMWQAERQMMTYQRQEDPTPASEEEVPFLRWGTTHRRSSPPPAATTRPLTFLSIHKK